MYHYVIYINNTGDFSIHLYRNPTTIDYNGWNRRVGNKEGGWWGAFISKESYIALRKLQKDKKLDYDKACSTLLLDKEHPYYIDDENGERLDALCDLLNLAYLL